MDTKIPRIHPFRFEQALIRLCTMPRTVLVHVLRFSSAYAYICIIVLLEVNDDSGIVFGAVAGSIILILLLIVLLPWLRNYLCPGLTFGYCIHKTKEVNVERAFDEELLLDDEKITVLKEIAR